MLRQISEWRLYFLPGYDNVKCSAYHDFRRFHEKVNIHMCNRRVRIYSYSLMVKAIKGYKGNKVQK